LVHPFDHLVLGTPYLQFREIAAASVERSPRLFHNIYIYIQIVYIYILFIYLFIEIIDW
jgi:hypothetical protein